MGYRWLRVVPLLLSSLVGVGACERPDWQVSDTAPLAGLGGTPPGAAGTSAMDACALDRSKGAVPIFSEQTVLNTSPGRREVWAYVNDAEAKELRATGTLFPPLAPNTVAPVPPVLAQLSIRLNAASSEQRAVIESLQQRFKRVRSTWPNPWALRLVDHPGSEHMNPVRILFREEAWFARISDKNAPVILDMKNQIVSNANAALEPDRIAAIFFVVSPQAAGTSFTSCEQGLRDFSVPNERMIESWSLGTPEILERLDADAKLLSDLFGVVRSCSTVDKGGTTFRSNTVCNTWAVYAVATEYSAYGWSLANPAELYKPSAQNLLGLVDALKSDRFEPDPFVVTPDRVVAAGGAGGAGGASAGSAGGGAFAAAGASGAP
jgi:hypothetical protein